MASDLFNELDYEKSSVGSRPTLRRSPDRPEHVKRVHAGFGFVGFVLGIVAAVYAYNETSSIALPIFLLIVVQNYIGRGLGDVVTDPEKGKRFVYFTLHPAAAVAVFCVTYQWWATMWLSAILGLVVGGFFFALLGMLLFPTIVEEENADSMDRFKHGGVG